MHNSKLFQLLHWGPVITLCIITTITCMGFYCNLMWWPVSEPGGGVHLFVYFSWLTLILFNYFKAAFIGPGFVPLGWRPENGADEKFLQYCKDCRGYKAPRSHHCRKCKRCVMKMDHHCPWINTCCGHFNHLHFTLFLLFAPIGCLHAAIILCISLYRALFLRYYIMTHMDVPFVYLDPVLFILTIFSIGLSIGVLLSVGTLFFIQMKSILKNETGIESWIIAKAVFRHEVLDETYKYPYNLGWRKNLVQVFNLSRLPQLNGFYWHVIDGCDQYTFTKEQLIQKKEKQERSICYTILEPYSGACLPISKGCRVLCSIPCSEETRLASEIGDQVIVTRWKKHWLYGDKIVGHDSPEQKGWFPRRCAVELIGNGQLNEYKSVKVD